MSHKISDISRNQKPAFRQLQNLYANFLLRSPPKCKPQKIFRTGSISKTTTGEKQRTEKKQAIDKEATRSNKPKIAFKTSA